ncbi:hypothetical protein LSUE1_G005368 [Lachnellula suecica]|uniref:Uncharacterized protein n=1 Tax=Lachnellula suecica TaxID=602035 RepID=A0A8T9C366_9HELO|nr:hypothetical protein LSUE1_G005368 [Lachnellula suecica]
MPSRGNPNVPNKQRRVASRAKVQKRNSVNKISKNPRGRPQAAFCTRRAELAHPRRAVEKAMEQEGEVEMTDAPKTTKPKTKKEAEDKMEVDEIA